MRKLETYGHVDTTGTLKISRRSDFVSAVRTFAGRRVRVIVEPIYRKRSTMTEKGTGQNGYYWGIVVNEYRAGAWDMQQRMLSSEEAHAELKANCNYIEHVSEITGEIMRSIRSTADMTTVEFEEYLERCRVFIKEWFGIRVPMPSEQGELEFKTK